jgi:hypothetical protein
MRDIPQLKAVSMTGRGGLYCCETSRIPYFVGNRLKDGGDVTLTRLLRFPPSPPHFIEDSWYSFLLEAVSTPGP